MNFLEKDLEEIVYESYKDNPEGLAERGLKLKGFIKRQLKIGNYGIADLVTFERGFNYNFDTVSFDKDSLFFRYKERKITITVYELKKDKIGISALLQGVRYLKGIQNYLNEKDTLLYFDFKLVLIGKELDMSGSFCYMTDIFDNIELITYKYGLDGLEFKKHRGYHLMEENFKI